ncbi:hypothetical protein, partial [Nocardiopsis gilva]|uniref:hypothetical protein n=1 Tax=Nocardiopsis gilva TaxID=280236 RepID=UPI000477D0E6
MWSGRVRPLLVRSLLVGAHGVPWRDPVALRGTAVAVLHDVAHARVRPGAAAGSSGSGGAAAGGA